MKRLLTLFISLVLFLATCEAAYVVHSVDGDVKVITGNTSSPLKKGMTVSPSDMIDIPSGATLEIYNELDKKVYTSVKSGRLSVIRLMLDAKEKAADNAANVGSQMSMKRGDKVEGRLYMEKGMVKRSKGTFNPALENVDVDPRTLARYVASAVYSGDLRSRIDLPVSVEPLSNDSTGKGFRLVNRRDFPVYFNVLKIIGTETPVLDISELGQPSGCYMVLPGQSLSREQFAWMSKKARHVIIVSHCKYDISEVIDMIEDLMNKEGIGGLTEKDIPVDMISL